MAKRMRKKQLVKTVDVLNQKVRTLEQDIQLLRESDVNHLAERIRELDSILVEAGILEREWQPEAPKGSFIKSNFKYFEPTYTKINKVWE
jgi:hypothetical protein